MTDKRDTPPEGELPQLVGWTKSYTLDGDTTEFNPREFQIHEFSPELRQQMSQIKLPRLKPEDLEDTIPPNAKVTAPVGSTSEAASSATAAQIVSELPQRETWTRQRWQWPAFALLIAVGAVYLWTRNDSAPNLRAGKLEQGPRTGAISPANTGKSEVPPARSENTVRIPSQPVTPPQLSPTAPSPSDDTSHAAPAQSAKGTIQRKGRSLGESPPRASADPERAEPAVEPGSSKPPETPPTPVVQPPRKKRWIELSDE